MKKIISCILFALTCSLSHGASTVLTSIPSANAPLSSAPIRANFTAANTDINNILTSFAGTSAPVNPSPYQYWINTTSSPYVLSIYDGMSWVQVATLNTSSHVWSVTSVNLSGGATGSIPYQSAANTTAFLASGTNGMLLTQALGVPAWTGAPNIGAATGTSLALTGAGSAASYTASGLITNSNGTSSAPSNVFNGSSTTGLYWANPGVGFSVAGAGVGTLTATGLNGMAIGQTTPAAGTFTSVTNANGAAATPSNVFTGAGTTGLYWANPGIGFSVAGTGVGTMTATGLNGMAIGQTTPAAGSFTTLTTTSTFSSAALTASSGAITPSYPTGVKGVTSGSTITAGGIGEIFTSTVTSGNLTTATATSVTSISPTAGAWEITASAYFNTAASTVPSSVAVGISTTNNGLPSTPLYSIIQAAFNTSSQQGLAAPTWNVNISGTTTYYCVVFAAFTVSTMTATCKIEAVRRY